MQKLLAEIQPLALTQAIRVNVSQFFGRIKQLIDDIEMGVMSSIKHSVNLESYLSMAENIAQDISPEIVKIIEAENDLLEDKISTSKFAYVVLKH